MNGTPRPIRTPDQRLRVFVSSTLKELAAERGVVRAAIERMGMAPVMFELGARPHPPRNLYRAYLEQSDIFLGIYGERYGWVPPGEDVSGLEDEYTLAPPAMPKLLYIKDRQDAREPRLAELLDRIRRDDGVSFKYYADAAELAEVVPGDLAVLLAERFDRGRHAEGVPTDPAAGGEGRIPAQLTQLIGREDEVPGVVAMLRRPSVRLLSLVGPGGIGKSRLAIDVAGRVGADFPDGVTFVSLASVEQWTLVGAAIARALGVPDTGATPIADRLAVALRRQRRLLVLDNFEQVLDAAPLVLDLLGAAPELKVLVTSRALLRVSGEHSFEVGPLSLPTGRPSQRLSASVELFVERARAVKPDFELGPHNIEDVEQICIALEGVPLALELAAARIRFLSPSSLLKRLDRQLNLLVGGRRDLPPRQQALRSTIEWSTKLLTPGERGLLEKLGVFSGSFSLEAAESIADEPDTLTLLGGLVDSSLLRQHERGGLKYFSMLGTVREYALEQLEATGATGSVRERHAEYYQRLAADMQPQLKGPGQRAALIRLQEELDNIGSACRRLLDARDWEAAAMLAWRLFLFFWAAGQLGQGRSWTAEILASGDPLPDRTRAMVLYLHRTVDTGQTSSVTVPDLTEAVELFERESDRFGEALSLVSLSFALGHPGSPETRRAREAAERGLELFRKAGDVWGQSLALITLGRAEVLEGNAPAAIAHFTRSLELATGRGDEFGATVARTHLSEAKTFAGDLDGAEAALREALRYSMQMRLPEGEAYGLPAAQT